MNDMNGAGWTTIGTKGLGPQQLYTPQGVFVDDAGHIFVLDILRIVRMTDMAGGGWSTFGMVDDRHSRFNLPESLFVR